MLVTSNSNGLHLVDLMELNDVNFEYDKLYEIINNYLFSLYEKKSFFVEDIKIWNDFIQRFTDRYYSRTLSFDTFLEFKIKLKNCMERNKIELQNTLKASLIEFDLLDEYKHYIDYTTNTSEKQSHIKIENAKNKTNSNYEENNNYTNDRVDTVNRNLNQNENNKSNDLRYDLLSTAPQENMNIKNMFDGNNYVSSAENQKNENETENKLNSEENSRNTSQEGVTNDYFGNSETNTENNVNSNSNDSLKNDVKHEQIEHGYNTNPVELLNKYSSFSLDAINKLLQMIENDSLFLKILY